MAANLEELSQLLAKPKSERKILGFFRGMTEKERRVFSSHCAAWYKQQLKSQRENMWNEHGEGAFSYRSNPLLSGAVLAAYCCCPFEIVKSGGWQTRIDAALISQAISDRRPSWADDWMTHAVKTAWISDWSDLRKLIREGVCEKPNDDHYIRLMIDGTSLKIKNVGSRLIGDPELLDADFWRIFEVPGVMRNESRFGYLDDAWLAGILTLEKQKVIDRVRLFDAILATPHMGFNQAQIKFFLTLHDRLRPSGDELASRFSDYVGLTDSPLAPVAKWSFELLRTIDRNKKLSVDSLEQVLIAGLLSSTKSRVKEAIKWLNELLKRDPEDRERLCEIALTGLQHENSDAQAEAWNFLAANIGDSPSCIEKLRSVANDVSPSVRKSIAAWFRSRGDDPGTVVGSTTKKRHTAASEKLSQESASSISKTKRYPKKWLKLNGIESLLKATANSEMQIPPTEFQGTEFKRLSEDKQLSPIVTIDELLDKALLVIETADRYTEAELVIDALARIKPPDEHPNLGPLKKRINQLFRRVHGLFFQGCGYHIDLVAILSVWGRWMTEKEVLAPNERYISQGPVGLAGFLSIRNRAIFDCISADKEMHLLGTMSHEGGWLDPLVLAKRLQQLPDSPNLLQPDQILSLLRLAPDSRKSALKEVKRLKKSLDGEYVQALRYALGDKVKIGENESLWVAAARSRNPYGDDKDVDAKFPGLGPDTGLVAKYDFRFMKGETVVFAMDSPTTKIATWDLPKNPRMDLPSLIAHQFGTKNKSAADSLDTKPEPRELVNLAATVMPLNRDSFYAHRYIPSDDLDALFDPCTPMNQPQMHALVQSLISGYVVYAPEVASAIDLAISTISDGRYDAQLAGKYLAMSIQSVQRFTKSLTEVAKASNLHAFQVIHSILAIFDHDLGKKIPARISDLFSLLYELVQGLEFQLPQSSVDRLQKWSKGSGKTAKTVKQLLAFVPETPLDFDSIRAAAIDGRFTANRTLIE